MQKAWRAPAKGTELDIKGLDYEHQLMGECDLGMDSAGFQPWPASTGSQNFHKCFPLVPSALLLPSNAPTCHTRDHMGQQLEKPTSFPLSCPSCQVCSPAHISAPCSGCSLVPGCFQPLPERHIPFLNAPGSLEAILKLLLCLPSLTPVPLNYILSAPHDWLLVLIPLRYLQAIIMSSLCHH